MQRRAIIALAALALGCSAYAADSRSGTSSTDQSGQSAVSGENSTPSTGRTGNDMGWQSRGTANGSSVDKSVDTRKNDPRHMGRTGGSYAGSEEENDNTGARTGGYLAAGIGIAALIGLFASRRSRTTTSSRYDVDDDDFNRPSGVGPSPRV